MKIKPDRNRTSQPRIHNSMDLRHEIESMELKCFEKEMYLRELFGELKESVKPGALIKSALPASVSLIQPFVGNKILRTALGFAAGALFKRFTSRKKKGEKPIAAVTKS